MTCLMEEINRHRGGEDNRTTIEPHCERRQNIKGRNLEKDFDSHAPAHGGPVAHGPRPPNSPRISEGFMVLAPPLRMMV
jgi:hypothetical protein